jgi:LDH2 family malate/lactate/ureidoglycolate dehydrogenase
VADHAAFLVVDAHDTFGQIACYHTMRTVIDRARLSGVALALVRNTTSAGALGYFAMQAANEKMIGLAINNSPPLQPAWGGKEKLVGNQAFAVASPADRHKPLLLDMATSAITLARIHEYQAKGLMLPEGVALDAAGEPTVDPATALAGMLLPMGGHRGYGLALMWEVLTGVLAGSDRYASNVTMPGVAEQAQGVSVFLLAIDPTFSMPYDAFVSRVDSLIDAIHATPPAVDNSPVVVPGERSHEAERRHHLEGIWLSAELVATLEEIGTEAGISFASFV